MKTRKWKTILKKFLISDVQVEAMFAFQELSEELPILKSYFSFVMQILYDCDIIEEDAILTWNKSTKANPTLKTQVL